KAAPERRHVAGELESVQAPNVTRAHSALEPPIVATARPRLRRTNVMVDRDDAPRASVKVHHIPRDIHRGEELWIFRVTHVDAVEIVANATRPVFERHGVLARDDIAGDKHLTAVTIPAPEAESDVDHTPGDVVSEPSS